ncbi:MAG: M48 family metalloprotease [Bdellovibrionales bacterium]|nr:M48 family metalloprotease [Bdellovibrionales bacterium]
MKMILTLGLAAAGLTGAIPASTQLCRGFLPENNLRIPPHDSRYFDTTDELSEAQFNHVLERISSVYTPIFSARGEKFAIQPNWADGTVNAYAYKRGKSSFVDVRGGLARVKGMTEDAFMMVVCHEVGHHLGGAPIFNDEDLSVEGQADYFANLQCMKNVLGVDNNQQVTSAQEVDSLALQDCQRVYSDAAQSALCNRISMAGVALSNIMNTLSNATKAVSLGTPDPKVVAKTDSEHPETQCRLDTYFNGALCNQDPSIVLDKQDPSVGTCTESAGYTLGLRPRCWFAATP